MEKNIPCFVASALTRSAPVTGMMNVSPVTAIPGGVLGGGMYLGLHSSLDETSAYPPSGHDTDMVWVAGPSAVVPMLRVVFAGKVPSNLTAPSTTTCVFGTEYGFGLDTNHPRVNTPTQCGSSVNALNFLYLQFLSQ